jgi:predicted transcriptional regulator
MSQMRLFDMAHYAEMLERMEHKVDCLNRKMDALLAIKTDDQPTLLAMVAAGPALEVVPNEDEAMPVAEPKPGYAYCRTCELQARTAAEVERDFGYRTPAGRETIVQSWCRECRALEQATSPRKKQRLPDDVRELGIQARDLHKQADAKAEERAKVLAGSKGRETKDSVELLVEEQDLRTEAVRLLSEYDQKRGILRKAKKAAK